MSTFYVVAANEEEEEECCPSRAATNLFAFFLLLLGHLIVYEDTQETKAEEGSWEDMQPKSPALVARNCLATRMPQ